jgi:uncharacterized ferritin-like protein (DUF455 family)
MKLYQLCEKILLGSDLADKTFNFSLNITDDFWEGSTTHSIERPGRSKQIEFSEIQDKFPRAQSLKVDAMRGKAIHFFANHELLALEIMAYVLLKLPHATTDQKRVKIGILQTMSEEQKHFKLYLTRMNELGVQFGDFHLNQFFWAQTKDINSYAEYFAIMALTFENANLDFSCYYRDLFKEVGDEKSSNIMQVVYDDEIGHVALGRNYLMKKSEDNLWDYYLKLLPEKLTPARAKGIAFDRIARERAGFDQSFISNLENYQDQYRVTKRRQWE